MQIRWRLMYLCKSLLHLVKETLITFTIVVNLISARHMIDPRATQYHTLPGFIVQVSTFFQRLQAIKVGRNYLVFTMYITFHRRAS